MSIKPFLTIYSWCISISLIASCTSGKVTTTENEQTNPVILVKPGEVKKFKMQIDFPQAQLSGILIAKNGNDTILGAFVNEFGIKVFEFRVNLNQAKVQHLPGSMDKWYIRKTLSDDLSYIFSPYGQMSKNADTIQFVIMKKGKSFKELDIKSDSLVIMKNNKRNISYQLKVIK
jgi:hypothetical protein